MFSSELSQDFSTNYLLNIIFHSDYYSGFYIFQAIYVCLYIRSSSVYSMQYWRSFILGFMLLLGPRFIFGWMVERELPELLQKSTYFSYIVIWIIVNFCPFDLFYKFCIRSVTRFVLSIICEFGNGQLLYNYIWISLIVYQNKYLSIIYLILMIYGFQIFIDYLDNIIFHSKRRFMLYPITYLKRILFTAIIMIILSQQTVDIYHLTPLCSMIFAIFKFIDLIFHSNHPYLIYDFLLPKSLFQHIFTYYPSL